MSVTLKIVFMMLVALVVSVRYGKTCLVVIPQIHTLTDVVHRGPTICSGFQECNDVKCYTNPCDGKGAAVLNDTGCFCADGTACVSSGATGASMTAMMIMTIGVLFGIAAM